MKNLETKILSILLVVFAIFAFNVQLSAQGGNFADLLEKYNGTGDQTFTATVVEIFFTTDLPKSKAGLKLTIDGSNYSLIGSTFIANPDVEGATVAFTATGFNLYYSSLKISSANLQSIISAISVDAYSSLEIFNVTFTSNSDAKGKSSAIYNLGKAFISSAVFIGNGTNTSGSHSNCAIYNLGTLTLNVDEGDILFIDNKYHDSSGAQADGDIFNSSKGNILMTGGNDHKLIISGGILGTGNIVKRGHLS
jgi:hypothetical protein